LTEVDEDALAVEVLAHDDFISFGHLVHPNNDLIVVSISQRDQIGQFINIFWMNFDAHQIVLEGLLLQNIGIDEVELPIHFCDLHLLSVYLIVYEVAATQKDAPEQHSIPHFFSFPLNNLMPLIF